MSALHHRSLQAHAAGRRRAALVLDVAIALTAVAALAVMLAGTLAPRLNIVIPPSAMTPDDGHAFTFSGFSTHWPFAVPSNPDFSLAPADVTVTEESHAIGTLEPAHATIREQGGGLYNLWHGALWFSASDGTDPRTNSRVYRLEVQTRLMPSVLAFRTADVITLLMLLCYRTGMILLPVVIRWVGRIWRELRREVSVHVAPPLRVVAGLVPLTFGRTYALVSSFLLGGLTIQALQRPAPLFTQPDSFSYIIPGLLWAGGQDVTGRSLRDLGYPALTVLAVRLGSLATLPRIQLPLIVIGMACLLGALYLPLTILACRLKRVASVPRWLSTVAAAATAGIFIILLANHDLFMIDIQSAVSEGLNVLPIGLAALLYLCGCMARSPPRKLSLLAAASLVAYVSAMVTPHALIVVALCFMSFILAGLRYWRAFRSPAVAAICVVAALLALGINRGEAWITPRGTDYGPRILFCNHLDVIAPVFETSTAQRAEVAAFMRDTLSRVDGWPLVGYNGDSCIFNDAFVGAIKAAAQADNQSPAQWEQMEFLKGIVRNPTRYARDIFRQTAHFLRHPIANVDLSGHSELADADAKVLAPFAGLINMTRSEWVVDAANWVPVAYPSIAGPAKSALLWISELFAPVTLLATAIATCCLIRFRKAYDMRPEIAVLAMACFVAAFAATVVLTHTFDVGRYVTSILPISLLFWFISFAYLLHLPIIVLGHAFRRFNNFRQQRLRYV